MRRRAKVDQNHGIIVDALRKAGCSVQSLAAIGHGCPDLLVGRRGWRNLFLLEVKDGSKSPSRRKLTEDQVRWRAKWNSPVYTVTSVDEALRFVGVM